MDEKVVENLTMKQLLEEPNSLDDLLIPQSIVIDILLRLLFNEGNVSLSRFTEVMKLPSRIIDDLLLWMQQEHLVEVSKANGQIGRIGYVYTQTEAGKQRARDAFERSLYVGPVPVSIPFYNRGVELQAKRDKRVNAHKVQASLSSLVLPDDFHRRIGPAINSSTSLFLYGPPGNGKTTIAEIIGRLIGGTDPVWIPYSVTAGGHIIQIHDRLVHRQLPLEGNRHPDYGRFDQRWGYFSRPSVMVGGELKMPSLDLLYDPVAKIYEASLQMKANCGMFLLDDFGRQQVRPMDLLNRWIVPLESEVDFLRLSSGQTVVVPFKMLIVFSTNLDPLELVDDAFLRRIHVKVHVEPPTEQIYYQIFMRACNEYKLSFDKASFVYLLQNWYHKTERPLQAVHPRDLIQTIVALCEYEEKPPKLSPELIDAACKSYFVD